MELRKDYILDRWVYYSPGRRARPKEFQQVKNEEQKACFFCPGNEALTPPEIGRVGGKSWKMRWFENKFPAVSEEGNPKKKSEGIYSHANSYGKHEVIVETPSHSLQLWDLEEDEIITLLNVYKERIRELEKRKNLSYVLVFKNHGAGAGTSIIHSHSQVIATAAVPELVKEEAASKGKCAYCSIILRESKSERLCFENSSFVSFAPYASRFSYETWIFPKRHVGRLEQFSKPEMKDFAQILKRSLVKLKEIGSDYNFFIHYSPRKGKMHLHLEITPRISVWAGFELGSGAVINQTLPETAASFYRS